MAKREPLKTEAYFENVCRYYEQRIAENKQDFTNRPPDIKRWDNMHMFQYDNYYYLIRAYYSIGKPVEELVPLYKEMIHHWHEYYSFPEVEGNIKALIETYVEALQFLGLAILLKTGKETIDKLAATLSILKIDTLLARFTNYLELNITAEKKLFYKKSFAGLEAMLEGNSKEEGLKTYLSEWMTVMKPTTYAGAHKIKVNETAFAGYWSFEAAAICVMEKLDREKFRDQPFFPIDLVDHYFETK